MASITRSDSKVNKDSYWVQWEKVAERLAKLPAGVQLIVVFLLPKVGAVGNLMPTSEDRDAQGYASAYEPVFSTHPRMPGPVLAKIDAAVRTVNDQIKAKLIGAAQNTGTAARLKFVDTYHIQQGYDYKNTRETGLRVKFGGSVTVDDRYLDGKMRFGWPVIPEALSRGGFFSAAGMHPSGVGYAILASDVMTMSGIAHDRNKLLMRAYREDRLLSDYPGELDMLVKLLDVIREAISLRHFDHSPVGELSEDMQFPDLLRSIMRIFIR